jgi:hypothetical protein
MQFYWDRRQTCSVLSEASWPSAILNYLKSNNTSSELLEQNVFAAWNLMETKKCLFILKFFELSTQAPI